MPNNKKIKSRYIPLTQQPYCCFPACIQTILLRRKISLISQEDIGHELGLIVPKNLQKILPRARTGKKPKAGWGTREGGKYSLNKFFKKYKINLKKEKVLPSKIKNLTKWFNNQIEKDNDVLVCFNYSKLYGGKGDGHLSVVNSVSGDEAILIDPEYEVAKFRKVKLERLVNSINHHYEKTKTGGFIIFSKKAERFLEKRGD